MRAWGPAAVWAAVIWTSSTRLFTDAQTSRFILPVLRWLLPGASPEILLLLHAGIRKFGHIAEYVVFSALLLRGLRGPRTGWRLAWGLAALGIAVGYAALDELHQAFVPGRGASLMDVGYDALGAAIGQAGLAWRHGRAKKTLAADAGTR